jgi:hypothetical protein
VEDLLGGKHLLGAADHVLKVYLAATAAAPSASADSVKADIAEISAANGYPSGGSDVQNSISRAAGVASLVGVDVVWTGTGAGPAAFGPLQFVVLYNDTQTTPADPLVAWWDYGSSITVNTGETFTVDFGSEIFTLT